MAVILSRLLGQKKTMVWNWSRKGLEQADDRLRIFPPAAPPADWVPHLLTRCRWTGVINVGMVGPGPYTGGGSVQRHDLLLFFGLQERENVVCGYFEVEAVWPLGLQVPFPPWLAPYRDIPNQNSGLDWDNALEVAVCAGRSLSWSPRLPAAGFFAIPDPSLVLTRPGANVANEWLFPEPMRGIAVSGHGAEFWKKTHFQARLGDADYRLAEAPACMAWARDLIERNAGRGLL